MRLAGEQAARMAPSKRSERVLHGAASSLPLCLLEESGTGRGPRNFVSGRLCRIIAVASRGFMDEL